MVVCAGDSVMNTSVLPHQTITSRSTAFSCLETTDVVDRPARRGRACSALLHVRSVEPLDVPPIEHRRPRPDLLQLVTNLRQQRRLEHARGARRRVAILLEDVPSAEHEIIQRGKRHHLADFGRAALGPLAEADRSPSGSAIRSAWPAPCGWQTSRDGRGADRAETDEQNAQPAACRGNFGRRGHGRKLYHL